MRQLRIKVLTTNNLQISGNLTVPIPQNSYRSRLSDVLNNSRNFIVLTEVEVQSNKQQKQVKMPFLYVNKPAITLLFEEKVAQTLAEKSTSAICHNS